MKVLMCFEQINNFVDRSAFIESQCHGIGCV
jgi:hypothetical protein